MSEKRKNTKKKTHPRKSIYPHAKQLDMMLDHLPECYWISSESVTDIFYVSRAFEDIWGISRQELYRKPHAFMDPIHPDDLEHVRKEVMGRPEGPWDFAYRIARPDGKTRWIHNQGFPVRDKDGRFLRMVGAAADVTHRKTAEHRARQKDIAWETLFENSNDAVFIHQKNGRMLDVNERACRMMGRSKEELLRMHVWELHPESARDQSRAAVEEFQRTGAIRFESKFQRKDGSLLDVEVSAAIVDRGSGLAQGIVRDITGQKQREQALELAQQQYRRLIEGLPKTYFFYRHDAQGVFDFVSPSIQAMLGYTPEEFCRHYTTHLTDAEVNKDCIRHTDASLRGESQPPYPVEIYRKDGSIAQLEVQETPVFGPGGSVTHVEGIAHDVTEERRIAATAHREAEFNKRLIETAQVIILVLDLEGRIVRFNPYMEEVSGYRLEEVRGKDWFSTFLPAKDRKKIRELFRRAIQDFEVRGNVNPIRTKDGRLRQIEWHAKNLKDAKGRTVQYMAVGMDITDKLMRQDALRESEERYRSLHENMTEGVCHHELVLDAAGRPEDYRIIEVNPAYTMLTDIPREHAVNALASRLYGTGGAPFLDVFSRVVRTGYAEVFEAYWPPMDKHFSISAIRTGTSRFAVIFTDITERKEGEQKLSQQKRFLEAAQKIGAIGAWELDLEKNELLWTDETYRIFGVPIGTPLSYERFLECIHPEDREYVDRKWKAGMRGEPYDIEHRLIVDGKEKWVREKAELTYDKAGKPLRGTGMTQDISERKKTEEHIGRVQKLESLGVMAGGIAHDFNNLLTAILGNLSIAKLEADDKSMELLGEIDEAAKQAKSITKQLLAFAKGSAPVKQSTDVRRLVEESARFVTCGTNARCLFRLPDGLPRISADPGQLGQVVCNLVINAQQAMPQGGDIVISAETVRGADHPELHIDTPEIVRISVRDKGVGIPEEHLGKLFDPYFTTKQQGSGLGLATAHKIIKQHGGAITVESVTGQGTVFHLWLPENAADRQDPDGGAGAELSKGSGRVLVIDDEDYIQRILGRMLKKLGYSSDKALDGKEALALYEKAAKTGRPFDAVIVDLTIRGGMGGKEAVRRLLELDPDVKAVVSSGYSDDPVMSEFEKHGFKAVIAKPYDIAQVGETLKKLLGAKV